MRRISLLVILISSVCAVMAQHCCVFDVPSSAASPVAKGAFVTLRKADGKILMDFPARYLDRPLLISSCVSRSSHYKWMGVGTRSKEIYARFELAGDALYLRRINADMAGDAADTLSMQSLSDSHMDAYIARLPLVASGVDTYTVDISTLFITERCFSPLPWYFDKPKLTLNTALSRVMEGKAFDDNFSVKTLTSYNYPMSDRMPAGVCSAEVVHTVLLLPESKMRPRLADSRVGLFTTTLKRVDFAESDLYQSIAYAQRWRVEPSDWEAWKRGELVIPKKQVVYYIDNAFPESWKAPLKRGILKWNEAFAKIGLKDVVTVRDYPVDDPDFDEDNLKYNCIRYIPTDRGGAQGPCWVDPSTGEILSASVYVWATLLETMSRFCYAQTAQVNPDIRGGRLQGKALEDAVQMIITHEIGHTLGLAHNMGGSSAYPVDSLRNADFVRKNGLTTSVMDYIYYNYIIRPGEEGVPLWTTNLGCYDDLCIKYIYTPTDASLSVREDLAEAEKWLDEKAGDPRYRYGVQQWGTFYDPSTLIDDISDDAVAAGKPASENLRYILSHLNEWLAGGDNLVYRKGIYDELQKQYQVILKNALYLIGGVYQAFHKEGTEGQCYASVPYAKQKEAMQWLAGELRSASWIDDPTVRIHFEAGLAPSVKILDKMASELVSRAEIVTFSSHLAEGKPYTLREYVDDWYAEFFEGPSKKTLTETDKVLQRSLLRYMLRKVEPASSSASKADHSYTRDDAAQAFALRPGGGSLDHVDVSLISEERAYFRSLMDRVEQLFAQKLKTASPEDAAHYRTVLEMIR